MKEPNERQIHLFPKSIYEPNQSNEIMTQLRIFQSNIQKQKDKLFKMALQNKPYELLLNKKLKNNLHNKKINLIPKKSTLRNKLSYAFKYSTFNHNNNLLLSPKSRSPMSETEENKSDKLCYTSQQFSHTKPRFNKSLYSFTKPLMTDTSSFSHFHPMSTVYNSSMNFLPKSRKLTKLIDINRQTYTESMKIKDELDLVKDFKRKKKYEPLTTAGHAVGQDVLNLIKDEALEIKYKQRTRNDFHSHDELNLKAILTQSNQISKISAEDIFKLRQSFGDQMGLNVMMNDNVFVFEKKYKINDKYITPNRTRLIINNQKNKNKIVKDLVHKIIWESQNVE